MIKTQKCRKQTTRNWGNGCVVTTEFSAARVKEHGVTFNGIWNFQLHGPDLMQNMHVLQGKVMTAARKGVSSRSHGDILNRNQPILWWPDCREVVNSFHPIFFLGQNEFLMWLWCQLPQIGTPALCQGTSNETTTTIAKQGPLVHSSAHNATFRHQTERWADRLHIRDHKQLLPRFPFVENQVQVTSRSVSIRLF